MNLQKATIEILDREAIDPGRGLPARIEVQFNPAEYSLTKGAQIAEIAIPGIDSPILQFIRGQNEKLTLDLFFDTTRPRDNAPLSSMAAGARDVTELTRQIYQLVKIQPRTHAVPRVRFFWGQGISFRAIVENVQQKFTLFSPDGIPLRATVSVSFREYKTLEEQLRELNLQSSDHTRQYTVTQGETLTDIAQKVYENPALWREIANHADNRARIANPRRLRPGTVLIIPPIDVLGGGSRGLN